MKGKRSGAGEIVILNRVIRVDFIKEVSFENKLEVKDFVDI